MPGEHQQCEASRGVETVAANNSTRHGKRAPATFAGQATSDPRIIMAGGCRENSAGAHAGSRPAGCRHWPAEAFEKRPSAAWVAPVVVVVVVMMRSRGEGDLLWIGRRKGAATRHTTDDYC